MVILSPSLMRAMVPPSAASGDICPTKQPLLVPENLPSVISAVLVASPWPCMIFIGRYISLIPGPPLGPSYLMTTTCPGLTLSSSRAFEHSSSLSKQMASPVKHLTDSSMAAGFATPVSGHTFPLMMATPPRVLNGLSKGLMTSSLQEPYM